MLKILFERRKNVYLPEIDAYCDYIRNSCPHVQAIDSGKLSPVEIENQNYDVHWRFMGFDLQSKPSSAYIVHEYGSLSIPPFAKAKNHIKAFINSVPQQRVYLNQIVKNEFSIPDNAPSFLRDMGIDQKFLSPLPNKKNYDFVYCGSLYRGIAVTKFLRYAAKKSNVGKILVIGDVKPEDEKELSAHGHIIFTGRVPYSEIPELLSQAKYGLNLMPDIYPFNIQTSTKILEYCATNLPIISNQYAWAKKFETGRNGKFFWLSDSFENFTLESIEKFDFKTPNVNDLAWPSVIKTSGIFDFIGKIS